MAILYNEINQTFTLHTVHSTYQMKVDANRVLLHTYYGERTDDADLSYLICRADRGFSGNPYSSCHAEAYDPFAEGVIRPENYYEELTEADRFYSLDVLPQEYSCFGGGDFRITGLRAQYADGGQTTSLFYESHSIREGKYALEGLPAVYAEDDFEAQTLEIVLCDPESGLKVTLLYGVLEASDIITRAARISNEGMDPVVLRKAASLSLDWMSGNYEWLTFHGRHTMERNLQRTEIAHGVQSVGSVRGASSHHYNPAVMVCGKETNEEQGDCYGFAFVYSGEFLIETEKDQMEQTRLICSIHPDNFAWTLHSGETFTAPEVIMAYSDQGYGAVSRIYHDVIREHICRGPWKTLRRPVLINNWEGTYFDFTGERLVSIAKEAAKLGVGLFVMDDGWFGKRDTDNSGLGDWISNEKKLGCSLKELGEQIRNLNMEFGIWFEPECISEDSDLYREHPDWAISVPGRKPGFARNQLVLDFSRKDVQDAIYEQMAEVLRNAPISYVKWDFNRHISDKYSRALPAERQGEMAHRYVLGLYRVLEMLNREFPDLLIEGCSGGGGRFDAGMLYYTPQIWCSDDTDPIERLEIQYGTSFFYPVSTMGAHVSAVPNHQTGRKTPLSTRACVAMAGTFGYELDLNLITEEEKEEVIKQIELFYIHYDLIQKGDYYRLTSPKSDRCTVWEMAAKDGSEALISAVYHHVRANQPPIYVKAKGLNPKSRYQVSLTDLTEKTQENSGFPSGRFAVVTGSALMKAGLMIPLSEQEYQAWQIYIKEV